MNQMHADNSFILSFQLRIHCQHITVVYSFESRSGKLTFLSGLIDDLLYLFPTHASSYTN